MQASHTSSNDLLRRSRRISPHTNSTID